MGEVARLDLSRLGWIDGNMCAALGAVLGQLDTRFILGPQPGRGVSIMEKNHFMRRHAGGPVVDTYGTTIEYTHFESLGSGSAEFREYVATHFRHKHKGLPNMTPALLKRFREALFEVFENALEHSYTEHGVFACGQFFPQKDRLSFSIADAGIGFAGNVERNVGNILPPTEAVRWALAGNTTRRGGRPGGLGLKLIQDFIRLNGGRLVVVSDTAYFEMGRGSENATTLPAPFPGSVLTLEIDTADTQSYCLRSELKPDDVF